MVKTVGGREGEWVILLSQMDESLVSRSFIRLWHRRRKGTHLVKWMARVAARNRRQSGNADSDPGLRGVEGEGHRGEAGPE